MKPAYLKLLESGELEARVSDAWRRMEDCDLCARYCHVNRMETIRGAVCRTGEHAVVHSHGPHHGEEDPLRGRNGSGTIFFSWCNLRCVYCQNWDISQKGLGHEVVPEALARMMLELQGMGCHNINFVSPSHVVTQIIAAVAIAVEQGLELPLVYNTGGYDSLEALRLLDGIVDIYMPDLKYADPEVGCRLSGIENYPRSAREALAELWHRRIREEWGFEGFVISDWIFGMRDAAASVRDEAGCRQFDVAQDASKPEQFFLYEIYDDEAAFLHNKIQAATHFAFRALPTVKAMGVAIRAGESAPIMAYL